MLALILYLFSLIALLIFLIFITVYGIFLIYSSIKGAPYVPTRKKVIDDILAPVKIKANNFFMELGSGDGRILRYAGKKYNCQGIGVDVNPILVAWAKILTRLERQEKKIDFQVKNIFDPDSRRADFIYLFLMPELIQKLVAKMNKELKPGAIVIAHAFPVKPWANKLFYTLKQLPFSTYYYQIR